MRAVLLCVLALACAPAVAAAQTPTTPPPAATTSAPAATTTAPAATTPLPITLDVEGSGTTDDDASPTPLVIGVLVGVALAALVLVAWGLLRVVTWEPGWLPRLQHAIGEAGYRFGGTWAQLRDWFSPRHR